ncbi:hypothetical protein [Acinetobacter sp. NyZ410]|uniref:hypothetical protein n=1 Tax=Acinetobacter TaxID=469 RepID=UPI001FBB9DF9|nr:hypothetical protein [Acinetobacter sp. NyZ410]UOH16908.1 hypothetical protein MTO68_13840 [Acinetobacter sp. NyZ410]
MKHKILKIVIFLVVWAIIYWIVESNFWFISFLFAYLFVYSIGKDSLIFLANEFDKNHNALADNVRDLYEEVQNLKQDKEALEIEVYELKNQISEINQSRH